VRSRRLQPKFHQGCRLISTGSGRPEFVCFLAAHDAGFQVFMTMKHKILPFRWHKTRVQATSSSEASRKVRRASILGLAPLPPGLGRRA
jgi:hypothetical protein